MAFQFSPKIVTDGLVLYLDAANPRSYQGSGTTWSDISRGGNTGTLVNGPTYSSANGGSIVFDGVDDVGIVDYQNIISQINNQASVQIILKLNSSLINSFKVIFQNRNNNDALTTLGLFFDDRAVLRTWNPNSVSNNRALVGYSGGGGTIVNVVYKTGSLLLNEWANIVLTVSTVSLNLYYNGQLTSTSPFTGIFQKPNVNFRIANHYTIDANSEALPANIATVQIYNRALTASEILQNYNAHKSRYGLT